MAIRYDHLQLLKNSIMILNASSNDSLSLAADTYTDLEVYRGYVNPGFDGTIEWIEASLEFAITGTAVANTLTGEWQVRERAGSTWNTIAYLTGLALTAAPQNYEVKTYFDGSTDANASPYELRLIISTTASTTLYFTFTAASMAVRTVGQSV